MNVQKALFLVPDHLESCRLMARLLDEKGDPRALEYYRFVALQGAILPGEIQLGDEGSGASAFFEGGGDVVRSGDKFLADKEQAILSPNATRDDAKGLALAALKYGRPVVAWDVANMLTAKWKSEYFPHLIKAAINAKAGDIAAQEAELRAALSKSENAETLRAYYEFLTTPPDPKPERSEEIVRVLDKISRQDSSAASLSLCLKILESKALDPACAPAVLDLIRRHPASDFKVLLFADQFQWAVQPAARPQILQALVKRLSAVPPAERLSAVDWLLDINEPAIAQALLPLKDAVKTPRVFQMWVEVAIQLKQWSAIEKALADSSNPLSPYQTQSLEATIAGIKGDSAKSRKLWGELLAKNRDKPEVQLEILMTLVRIGEWKILYAGLPDVLGNKDWARKAVDTLAPAVDQYRDSTLVLEFYRQAVKSRFLATDEDMKDRIAYNALVLGEPVSMDEVEMRAKKNPENASFRITHALAVLKRGSKVKALFGLKDVEPIVSPNGLPSRQKSIYAIALVLNGRVEEAQAVKKTIPPGSLTRQEEVLQAV
ncbi:MAG: hypothetical protein ACKOEZ_14020, partial [Spartobacteria bacterium]